MADLREGHALKIYVLEDITARFSCHTHMYIDTTRTHMIHSVIWLTKGLQMGHKTNGQKNLAQPTADGW